MLYFFLKFVHIISATLLLGTGVGTAFYMYAAHLSKNTRTMAFTAKHVVIADWMFTTPAVIIQPLTGVGLMHVMGYPFDTSWIIFAITLYVLMGFCWIPVVWLQIQIRERAQYALNNASDLHQDPIYIKYIKFWFWLGWPAFIAVIFIFYLMVFKPNL